MSIIDQLDADAKIAFNKGQLDDALAHSSHLIDELQKQVASALELRTAIWEKKANLTNELEDTLMIIKYDQDNTDAYLRAGKIYSIQGKQKKAIDILEQGLKSSASHRQRKLIQQQIAIAKARLERCIDFVTKVPYEVACNIFRHLSIGCIDMAANCLNVSSAWRNLLLQSAEAWDTLWFHTDGDDPKFWRSSLGRVLLPRISQNVKAMIITDERCIPNCIEYLDVCDFSGLQSLDVQGDLGISDNNLGRSLCMALHGTSHLTKLTIDLDTTISLRLILSYCPKLVYTNLSVNEITDWSIGPDTTELESVYLYPEVDLNPYDLEVLFRISPNLRSVTVKNSTFNNDEYDLLSAIEGHCPKISRIADCGVLRAWDLDYKNVYNEEATELQDLSLSNIRTATPLARRLEKASNSLRQMVLSPFGGGRGSTLTDWLPLSAFTMHTLTALSIQAALDSPFGRHLPAMLRAYPALNSLHLDGHDSRASSKEVEDSIFNAIRQLNSLKHLELSRMTIDGLGFRQLFQHYATQEKPILEQLLIGDVGVDSTIYFDVVRIRSLRYLYLRLPYYKKITEPDATELARLIADLPQLKKLKLKNMMLSVRAARYIGSSHSLETFGFEHIILSLSIEAYAYVRHLIKESYY